MIWDRLFGTFKEEEAGEEITYGTTTQLKSWNPAWANTHYYVQMYTKAKRMKRADKFKLIFAKPGWLPHYLGGPVPVKEVDKATWQKYDTDTNIYFKIYAIVQYFVLLGGGILYMLHYNELSLFYKAVFFMLILITMLITGGIFENKRWIIFAEYARLVLVLVSLNTFYYFWFISWFNFTMVVSSIGFAACVAFFTWAYINTRPFNTVTAD
jgi:hypothetical protein